MAVDPVAQAIVRQTADALAISAAQGITNAVRGGLQQELPTIVQALGEALNRRALPSSLLKETNLGIARAGQNRVTATFQSRLPRRGTSGGELSGSLLNALRSGSMLAGTTDRVISFVNPGTLDGSARHWYRVNYGALGPAFTKPGGRRPEAFTININSRPFARLADTHKPAGYSYLPSLFWWEGPRFLARGPAFRIGPGGYVTARGKRLGGSRPARFLDEGFRAVAEEFPKRYDRMFRTWVQQADNRARLQAKDITMVVDLRSETYSFTVTPPRSS
jgi:hypothetical protein